MAEDRMKEIKDLFKEIEGSFYSKNQIVDLFDKINGFKHAPIEIRYMKFDASNDKGGSGENVTADNASLPENDFINNEIEKNRLLKTVDTKECILSLFVTVFLLLIPFLVLIVLCSCNEKDHLSELIIFGVVSVIVSALLSFVIFLFLKKCQNQQEQKCCADNAILEHNKRVYIELLNLKTAQASFIKQANEQELEMCKKAELIRFDEFQKHLEHIRRCELKELELKERCLKELSYAEKS